jgi:small subunit ribosomal protein S8
MCQSDPIADFLTRIRNASSAGHRYADVRWSKMLQNIAEVLKESLFIEQILVRSEGTVPQMRVYLKYGAKRKPIIRGITRASKPGCRKYVGCNEIPRIQNGLGLAVLSTHQGVVSSKTARERGVGGELLCYVW